MDNGRLSLSFEVSSHGFWGSQILYYDMIDE